MKSYASSDIKNRMLTYLRDYANWEKVLEDSAIDSILSANSEALSEIARYLEHNIREKTWNTAQNASSINEELNFFGYKPKRKISSIGYAVFSHDSLLEDVISSDELEDLTDYSGANISIPAKTPLLINNIPFVTSEEATYTLGMPYLLVPVIQGTSQTTSTTVQKTLGIPFETLRFSSPNIEAAVDAVSSNFFSLQVTFPDNTTTLCTEVDSIFLAEPGQYAYELNNIFSDDPADDYIEVIFGNNVSGRIFPRNSVITLQYLSSDGADGVVSEKFVETGTYTTGNSVLYYTNSTSLTGGKDRESLEDIKINAPKNYLVEGSIVTEKQYKEAIEQIPYVDKALVYGGAYTLPGSSRESDVVFFSALDSNGETPDSTALESDVYDRVLDKKPPLDVLVFVEPDYVDIAINYSAEIDSTVNSDLLAVKSNILTLLYDTYNIFDMDFEEPIALNDIPILVNSNFPSLVKSSDIFIEAKVHLTTSTFVPSNDLLSYEKEFSFNPSFFNILDSGSPYLLRIDFVWSCENCSYKNRTIILVPNPDFEEGNSLRPYFLVKLFPYISSIFSQDYMDNYIYNTSVAPDEIEVGDADYYPFSVDYDHSEELKTSTLRIPLSYGTEKYIDFQNYSAERLDDEVSINAYAFSSNWKGNSIYPMNKHGIIRLNASDIKVEVY